MAQYDPRPVGGYAPNFDIVDIETNTSSQLSDYLGKVLILDLFATWCGPCIDAIPYIKRIQNSYSASDLQIISIDIDHSESYDKVKAFSQKYKMSWIVSLDESNMSEDYGSGAIPTMYIINQTGYITYSEVGFNYYGVINALDQLIDPDVLAPVIESPTITALTPTLSFDNNKVKVQVGNVTDNLALEEVFINVTSPVGTKIYPINREEEGGLDLTLSINPVQLFNTESVEVSIGAKDFRGNVAATTPVTFAVELVTEDSSSPEVTSILIQPIELSNQPSYYLYKITVELMDDTCIAEVEIVLKEDGRPGGYTLTNITRSEDNVNQFIGYITLKDSTFSDHDRLYVEVIAIDAVGNTITYSSLLGANFSETSSTASFGLNGILLLLGFLFYNVIKRKKRRIQK
jgi:thiol-disulfide isomerase/thioredoxin